MAYRIGWLLSIVCLLPQTLRTDEFLDQDGHDHVLNPASQIIGNGLVFTVLGVHWTEFGFAFHCSSSESSAVRSNSASRKSTRFCTASRARSFSSSRKMIPASNSSLSISFFSLS